MSVATVLAILTLTVAVPLLAYATWRLWRLWREFHNPVTRVQGISLTVVLVHAVVLSFIFLNNDMPGLGLGPSPIDTDATKLITRALEFGGGLTVALIVLRLFPRPGRKGGP